MPKQRICRGGVFGNNSGIVFLISLVGTHQKCLPQKGISNEYSQCMFLWRTGQNYSRSIPKYSSFTLCMLDNFACFFVVCGFFFKLFFFQRNLSGIPSDFAGLIWLQTVCKCYQQMIKVATSGEN